MKTPKAARKGTENRFADQLYFGTGPDARPASPVLEAIEPRAQTPVQAQGSRWRTAAGRKQSAARRPAPPVEVPGVSYPSAREIRDLFARSQQSLAASQFSPVAADNRQTSQPDIVSDRAVQLPLADLPPGSALPAREDAVAVGEPAPDLPHPAVPLEQRPTGFTPPRSAPVVASMWGGRPVPMPRQVGTVVQHGRPLVPSSPAAMLGPLPTYRVAELVTARGKTQQNLVAAAMTAPPTGGRHVVIGSLFGGVGASTVAVLLWQVWASHGRPGVLVDGSGDWLPGLVERARPDQQGPFWHGRDIPANQVSDLLHGRTAGPVVVRSYIRGTGPDTAEVTVAAQRLAAGVQLVITDLGAGTGRVQQSLVAGRPDLLVLVCRPDRAELQQTAEFLRTVHQSRLLDCQHSALIAATGPSRRWSANVRAGMAVVADVASGLSIPFVRRLADRTQPVLPGDAGRAVRVLAAATVVSPHHPVRFAQK